jgi:hypothetical protein
MADYAFISYSSKNQHEADSLRNFLKENGVKTWMAPYDIPAGSQYAGVITCALENSACVVLLLTNASQESQYVTREISCAVEYNKPIIPLKLEQLTLKPDYKFMIGTEQIIEVQTIDKDSEAMHMVLDGVRKLTGVESNELQKEAVTEKKEDYTENYRYIFDVGSLDGDGTMRFRSHDMYKKDDCVNVKIDDTDWENFTILLKKLYMAIYPGIDADDVIIKRNFPRKDVYRCIPDDKYRYYDEGLDFKVTVLRQDSYLYDNVSIKLDEELEITPWRDGDSVFKKVEGRPSPDDLGMDEDRLLEAAEKLIRFAARNDDVKVQKKFSLKLYDDRSGGYHLLFG